MRASLRQCMIRQCMNGAASTGDCVSPASQFSGFQMDKLHNPFKQALKSGKLQLGLWHSLSSHLVAEILAGAGFDWIVLDMEHAPNELPMVLSQLQAMKGGTAHPVQHRLRRFSPEHEPDPTSDPIVGRGSRGSSRARRCGRERR